MNFNLPTRFLSALSAGLVLSLAACHSSSDSPNLSASFSSTIDAAQVTTTPVLGTAVRMTMRNNAPTTGTRQSPVWVGFHDGTFDLYDIGVTAAAQFPTTNALERLAEDGSTAELMDAFTTAAVGTTQATVKGVLEVASGPIAPSEQITRVFRLDPSDADSRYFSYASMMLPSNDAFIANGDPLAHEIFDAGGSFVGSGFIVTGAEALDAGTEVNDELSANTAFFGQATPDTGTDEAGTVALHSGYMTPGSGGILDDARFATAFFVLGGYEFMSFAFTELATPTAATGIGTYSLNSAGDTLTYDISMTNLSGPATALSFNQALAGSDGAVVFDIFSSITSNANGLLVASGSTAVTATQRDLLTAGEIYLTVATALNPAGEVRGQVATGGDAFFASFDMAQEAPTTPTLGKDVRVTMYNLAPELGVYMSPFFVGFHDGSFDIFDQGAPATTFFMANNGLEGLAEDGSLTNFFADFDLLAAGSVRGSVAGLAGPLAPQETSSILFRVDPDDAGSRYFSYASMILPSNDAFIANSDPQFREIYDAAGTFVGEPFLVSSLNVRDAGTEVNDESPTNTAFFGQSTANTGTDELGNVTSHPGFLATGMGGILDDAMFANADFAATTTPIVGVDIREIGGTPTAPTGQAIVTLDVAMTTMSFEVACSGLSGAATNVHIHNAIAGVGGAVLYDIASSITTNADGVLVLSGTQAISAGDLVKLQAGELYFNVHTLLNPAGELRGQITAGN